MLLRPRLASRCGNSLAGAIPAAGFAIGTVAPLASGRFLVAVGGLALVAAFTTLAVRSFRMRVETTATGLTVHGMFRSRRIDRSAIVALDDRWTSYAAWPAVISGVTVPAIKWRNAGGRTRLTPIWALAISGREPGKWSDDTALQIQRLHIWVNADERFIPQ